MEARSTPALPTLLLPTKNNVLIFFDMTAFSWKAAWVLNCQPHDVPILVAARLLKPLGNPPPNSVKFFAASELLEQVKDRTWLAKVTNALNQHWQKRNAAKRKHLTGEAEKMHSRTESMVLR